MKFIAVLLLITTGMYAQTTQFIYQPKNVERPIQILPSGATADAGEKSVTLAALYSFLLPGMGELYVGNYSTGKYFTAAEGLLWVTLIGFDRYGTWVRNDARDYAVQHAGISIVGQADQYFVDIGDYANVQEYNTDMLRKRDLAKLYDERYPVGWNWDLKSNREHYRDLRVSSDQAFNNVSFVIAAIGINHLVSAVNAVLSARSHNSNIQTSSLLDVNAKVIGGINNPQGIMISLSKNF
jgi:TM2 domain-containing membrane protein YozV